MFCGNKAKISVISLIIDAIFEVGLQNFSHLDCIFVGGDELTEERARNVQKARMDGGDKRSSLGGVWPKNEDWHAIRIAYQVYLQQ